ncbi:hypothetical protein C8R44DRAFT_894983 [Mycena epipterygia]|nr:hypothetical protein C8R44DRAFT_894983 [Mycena epipterygia]
MTLPSTIIQKLRSIHSQRPGRPNTTSSDNSAWTRWTINTTNAVLPLNEVHPVLANADVTMSLTASAAPFPGSTMFVRPASHLGAMLSISTSPRLRPPFELPFANGVIGSIYIICILLISSCAFTLPVMLKSRQLCV